jgi:hypothetical protein
MGEVLATLLFDSVGDRHEHVENNDLVTVERFLFAVVAIK